MEYTIYYETFVTVEASNEEEAYEKACLPKYREEILSNLQSLEIEEL